MIAISGQLYLRCLAWLLAVKKQTARPVTVFDLEPIRDDGEGQGKIHLVVRVAGLFARAAARLAK